MIDPKYTRFTPAGEAALTVVEQLAEDLADAWETLKRNISQGMSFGAALLLFMQVIRDLLRAAYTSTWSIGRVDDFDEVEEAPNIEAAVNADAEEIEQYLQKVGGEVGSLEEGEDPIDLLARRLSRIVYFAGGAWKLFNLAKTFTAKANELWRWAGPVDDRMCQVCKEEMAAGPRPLGDITRYPARDTICGDNCRHELIKVG